MRHHQRPRRPRGRSRSLVGLGLLVKEVGIRTHSRLDIMICSLSERCKGTCSSTVCPQAIDGVKTRGFECGERVWLALSAEAFPTPPVRTRMNNVWCHPHLSAVKPSRKSQNRSRCADADETSDESPASFLPSPATSAESRILNPTTMSRLASSAATAASAATCQRAPSRNIVQQLWLQTASATDTTGITPASELRG